MRARVLALLSMSVIALAASDANAQESAIGVSDGRPVSPPTTLTLTDPATYKIDAMRREMHTYFEGEASEAWWFGTAGVVSLTAASLGLFVAKDDFYHGAAYPLAAFGIIELAAGIVLGLRTEGQIADRDGLLSKGDGRGFWELEKPRIKRVQSQFRILEIVEIGLTVVGLGLATVGGAKSNHTVTGIGVGLAFQASTLLALDHLASDRADRYANSILTFGN